MKATIAILSVVLLSGRASGQLSYLSANRTVSAEAEASRADFPVPNQDYYDFDNPSTSSDDLLPFMATVTADAGFWNTQATAWQDSHLDADRIVVHAGIRDMNHEGQLVNGYARGISAFTAEFTLPVASWLTLSNDIFLSNIGTPPFQVTNTARVSYSLTGPDVQVARDINVFQFQPTEDVPYRQFSDDVFAPAGTYTLIAGIESRTQGDDRNIDVRTELLVEVFPIPEPASLGLLGLVTIAISGRILARAVRSRRLRSRQPQSL